MTKPVLGFAICGSFCTFDRILPILENLSDSFKIIPIMSDIASGTDTRFYKIDDFKAKIIEITGGEIISSIVDAEPIGPLKLLDILLIEPCTGNTLSKLANGVSDTPVTLAAKAHLRNERPVVIALSSNDALSGNAQNLGKLLNTKNYYFVPMRQDDCFNKPNSMVSDFSMTKAALNAALKGNQMQPVFI